MSMNHYMISSQLFTSAFDMFKCNPGAKKNNFRNRKRAGEGECSAVKKKRTVSTAQMCKNPPSYSVPWIEKYTPQTKSELSVHKKKVSEVEEWLIDSLKRSDKNQGASLLLLTGPPGVGKTATIYALSKDLNLELREWTNSTQNTWNSNECNSTNSFPEFAYESQASTFRSFLLRANKYPSLFSSHSGRIVLVEELPNVFLKETAAFHEILRKFHRIGRCPLIFIVSDCTIGGSVEHSLFPKDLQTELGIKNISFNPIAPTMALKVLYQINRDANVSSLKRFSKAELEIIASECKGDIRNAVNTLHFLSAPENVKKTRPEKQWSLKSIDVSSSGNKDTSLFLFHALGKILYCKRDKTKKAEEYPLPSHLSHFSRSPLLANPEEVYSKTSITEESFILFLHQNYLSFVEDIKVAAECSTWFSDSETLTVEWSERHTMNNYATSLATRGLMFNLTPCSARNKWRPLHKPQFFNSIKDHRYLCQSVKYAFKGKQLSLRELQVDFIPYVPKITTSSYDNEVKQLGNQLGVLRLNGVHRLQSDSLSEKELCEVNLNDLEHYNEVKKDPNVADDSGTLSEPCVPDTPDEEFVIEECDI